MKQLFFREGRPLVGQVPPPGAAPGRIEVEVHFSAVSSGTEGSLLSETGRSLLSRAIEKRGRADRLWTALRRRDFSDIRTRFERLASRGQAWIVPGYSAAGIVRTAGPDAGAFAPGDRVAVAGAGYATHADLVTVPQNLAVRVPDGLSLAHASTAAVGAIALQAVRRADARIGETVAVLGLGLLGQIVARILAAAGCRVLAWDPREERVRVAATHGITALRAAGPDEVPAAVAALTAGYGADQVILAAAAGAAAVEAAARATRRAGTLVLLGDTPVSVKRETAYVRELDIRMSTSYGPGRYDRSYEEEGRDYPFSYVRWTENRNMSAWLELLASGRVRIDDLVRGIRDLDQAGEAYVALRQGTLGSLGLLFRHRDAAEPGPLVVASRPPDAGEDTEPAIAPDAGPGRPPAPSQLDSEALPFRASPRPMPIRIALLGTGAYAASGILPALAPMAGKVEAAQGAGSNGPSAVRSVSSGGRVRFELLAGTVPARRDPLALRYGFARTGSSYEEAAADAGVDLVVVVTRHDLRAQLIVPALTAGHAVFTEKPLAIHEEEIDRIEEALRSAEHPDRAFLAIGFNRRFAPAITRLRSELAGRRGPLQMSYRVQAGLLPETHWIRGPQGGGRLVGEAVHMLDLLRFLAAASLERAWIAPGGSAPGGPGADPAADNFQIGLRYADGSTASLLYTSRGAPGHPKERIELHWDGRSCEIENFQSLRETGRRAPLWQSPAPRKGQPEMWRAIVDALSSGDPPPVPVGEILETSRAVLALERARRGE